MFLETLLRLTVPSYVERSGGRDASCGTVAKYSMSGTLVKASLISGLATPISIAAYGPNLLIGLQGSAKIAEYSKTGQLINSALISGISNPNGIVIAGDSDNLNVPIGGLVKSVSYIQTDGTKVSAALSGLTGILALHGSSLGSTTKNGVTTITGDVDSIDVALDAPPTAKSSSSLSFKATKPSASSGLSGNGVVRVNSIRGTTLTTLAAGNVDFVGAGLAFTNYVGTATLRDLTNGAGITYSGTAPKPVTLTVQDMHAGSVISTASAIGAFKASNVGLGSAINAPSIAFIATSVLKGRSFNGDFGADLHLSGIGIVSPQNVTLGSAKVAGQLLGGDWIVAAGNTGAISAAVVASDWLGNFSGTVAGLTSKGPLSGRIVASSLSAVSAGTDLNNAYMSLNNPPASDGKATGLGKVSVGGACNNVLIVTKGNIGTVNITKSASNLEINANLLQTLTVKGTLAGSRLSLSQPWDAKLHALASLSAGTIQRTEIRTSGNIGSIKTSVIDHSLVFAGISTELVTLPTARSNFVDSGSAAQVTIHSIILTGPSGKLPQPALINSCIAAAGIDIAQLPNRGTAVSDSDLASKFGFATVNGVKVYVGPFSAANYIAGNDSFVK